MSSTLAQVKQIHSQPSPSKGPTHFLDGMVKTDRTPKVTIKGDIRLQVAESDLAFKTVKGNYSIDVEDMQEPLQVIWIVEGSVLNHNMKAIDIEFDMKGARAGQVWTYLVAAQVTDREGLGCIVHSSIFVQILVTLDIAASRTVR